MTVSAEQLRAQLRKQFPQAHRTQSESGQILADSSFQFTADSFPNGVISEIIPSGPASGLSLVLSTFLGDPGATSPLPDLVLIDGTDRFDPSSFSGDACSRLLWVRCSSGAEVLKAADLLLRDGNLSCLLVDISGMAKQDLGSIPASAWWRLKQLAETTGGRLVVLSPFPTVPCAGLRLSLAANLTLSDFDFSRSHVLQRIRGETLRMKRAN